MLRRKAVKLFASEIAFDIDIKLQSKQIQERKVNQNQMNILQTWNKILTYYFEVIVIQSLTDFF